MLRNSRFGKRPIPSNFFMLKCTKTNFLTRQPANGSKEIAFFLHLNTTNQMIIKTLKHNIQKHKENYIKKHLMATIKKTPFKQNGQRPQHDQKMLGNVPWHPQRQWTTANFKKTVMQLRVGK